MILSRYVFVTIGTRNVLHWRSKGYDVKKSDRIKTAVSDLPDSAKTKVACRCNECGSKYIREFKGDTERCWSCKARYNVIHVQKWSGENHPKWNPHKTDFVAYGNKVRWLSEKTYRAHIDTLNPLRLPRTICGVDGGYQLDHILSIKKGFELDVPPEQMAELDNLQLLPWEQNRTKWS